MGSEKGLGERLESLINGVIDNPTAGAIGREAIKDVRSKFNEVFFGQPEHGGEIGAPLNPPASEIAEAREADLPSPSEIANDNTPYRPEHGYGPEHDRGIDR